MKIQDISYLPDPCPLPEQIKKRALIEKEKLIYAPFSGVGGIVYDKDAVYVELGGSHSYNKPSQDDDGDDRVTDLKELKETFDMKREHSEIQIFTDRAMKADDVENGTSEEENNEQHKQLCAKNTKEELEIEGLNSLRTKTIKELKEEKVVDCGRSRRKVIFDTSDDELLCDLNSDSEDEQERNVQEKNTTYTKLKINKDDELHNKVANILKNLENKKVKDVTFANKNSEDEETEDTDKEVDEDSESYDELSDDEVINGKVDEVPESDIDQVEASDDSEDENMGVKWKENLSKKAENAFLERQNNTKNLMKLVYGKKLFVYYLLLHLNLYRQI